MTYRTDFSSRTLALALLASLALAACGGGGGGDNSPAPSPAPTPAPTSDANSVPPSAAASVQSYVQYVGSLPANDVQDPLAVTAVSMPPVSETDEPKALH